MPLTLTAEPAPLHEDQDGVLRVGNTRVSLEVVISAWRQGKTAEQIQQSFDTLALADIYAAITYYLNHRDEVEKYLQTSQQHAQQTQNWTEARCDPTGIKSRLQARQRRLQQTRARKTAGKN
jgi:uncharacterized protein (DUF433 family)